ncbi:MAG: hypothetical protein PHX21_09330 [bacterium]|nr:hypothetical protein [bacterium]
MKKFEEIKTGWARLDKKKQDKLRAMRIRSLGRTPGKLLTANGAIPGTLGSFGTVYGKLSWTGDKAEANMGFRPKEGATGVLLSRRRYVDNNGKVKSGIFAMSLMPWKPTVTKDAKCGHLRMNVLGRMASNYNRDMIYPIWEPLVKNKNMKPYTGYHYFMSVNNQNIGNDLRWEKLQISRGVLNPPKCVCANRYDMDKKEIQIFVPRTMGRNPITVNQVGIGIFDRITGDFFHISPEQFNEELEKKLKASGLTVNDLERVRVNSVIEPLRFKWQIREVMESMDFRVWNSDFGIKETEKRSMKEHRVNLGVYGVVPKREIVSQKANFREVVIEYEKPYIKRGKRMRSEHLRFYIHYYYKRVSPETGKPEYSPSICRRVIRGLPGNEEDRIDGKHSVPVVIEVF